MVWFPLDFIDFETVFTVVPGTMFDFGDRGFRLMPIIPPRCHQEVTKCDKQLTPSEDMSLGWLGTMSPPTLWRISKSPTRISFGRHYKPIEMALKDKLHYLEVNKFKAYVITADAKRAFDMTRKTVPSDIPDEKIKTACHYICICIMDSFY